MLDAFWTALALSVGAMFPIINPIGHAPMFYAMTQGNSAGFRHRQALKTSIYVFIILVISLMLGDDVLRFFGINIDDMRIGGGLLVAYTAWGMLSNTSRVTPEEDSAAMDKNDISLTPMATPILAGPGAMSLALGLLSFGQSVTDYAGYITGFFLIALLNWVCMRYADSMVRVLNPNAIGALNRILGFFILAIGVDLMVRGVKDIFFPSV